LVDFSVGWVNWRFKRRLLGRRFWQGNQRGLRQIILGGRWFAGVLRLAGRFGIDRLGRWNFCLRFRVMVLAILGRIRVPGAGEELQIMAGGLLRRGRLVLLAEFRLGPTLGLC
jgi:hypothetical protein